MNKTFLVLVTFFISIAANASKIDGSCSFSEGFWSSQLSVTDDVNTGTLSVQTRIAHYNPNYNGPVRYESNMIADVKESKIVGNTIVLKYVERIDIRKQGRACEIHGTKNSASDFSEGTATIFCNGEKIRDFYCHWTF